VNIEAGDNATKKISRREIGQAISRLTNYNYLAMDIRVFKLISAIRKENAPEVARLKALLGEKKVRAKAPRWPENTPQDVLDACALFWRGTTEFHSYRIHCWNDVAIWTSYPSGGYSDNGGYHRTPPCYSMIHRVGATSDRRSATISSSDLCIGQKTRFTMKIMQQHLDEFAKTERRKT
jgi:hypothetical protein